MLFQNVLCVCFLDLLASKIETNAQLNSQTEKPETLFADVIKNISRVNHELQDLINNYEQFKKTQNSLENFDDKDDYISDAEGGRVNKNIKHFVGNERDSSDKTSSTLKFQTQMIYVEDETHKSNKPEKSIETEKSSQSQESTKVEKSHEVEPRKAVETTDKKKLNVQKTITEASIADEESIAPKEETESENQEFLDIHKKMKTNIKKRIIPEGALEQALKKIKYFEKDTHIKYVGHNSSGSVSSIEGERHREEVDVSKPKNHAYEKDTDFTQITAGIYLRSQNKTTKKLDYDLSLELTDDDEALSKDLFKTSVLRQAYGDACFKVVIRKCYRACKSAYKSSCQVIKCQSELKQHFDKSSRTGCIDAFNASSKRDNSYSLRRIVGPEALYDGIMTREGYLSMACQTQIEKPTRRMTNNETNQNGEQLNILRDQYERACQKISQGKCGKACQYAHHATCTKYRCRKSLNKNFKRNCRSYCKIAFSNKAKKSSDSDDDSSTDSDSDDSDSDDSDSDDDDTREEDDDDDDDDEGDES